MAIWKELLSDERGFVLSAEAALLGTVGVVGATIGLSAARDALDAELTETAYALRSLDQSYSFQGRSGATAWTAGSRYVQEPAFVAHEELREQIERDRKELAEEQQRKEGEEKKRRRERRRGDRSEA